MEFSASSPRKRGCFCWSCSSFFSGFVFPAQAGVFPTGLILIRLEERLPRASGGVSFYASQKTPAGLSSPRKRGCFRIRTYASSEIDVFPAQAGVFLTAIGDLLGPARLPRASGGVSDGWVDFYYNEGSSPRKRGCFRSPDRRLRKIFVFPAQAGVFPLRPCWLNLDGGLPRASGGVSRRVRLSRFRVTSSPRKRGCFHQSCCPEFPDHVFHAQAGVFLIYIDSSAVNACLPRASGGVSRRVRLSRFRVTSSPRKRGCFYDCTRLPDLKFSLPRASGGVSTPCEFLPYQLRSSPRKRGCFHHRTASKLRGGVFPAQAGVFPSIRADRLGSSGLPRASGGVSITGYHRCDTWTSSPRKRGCFYPIHFAQPR